MYMVKRLDLWVNIEENTDEKTQFGKCLFCLTLYCTVLCTVLFRHYYSSGGFPPLPDTQCPGPDRITIFMAGSPV